MDPSCLTAFWKAKDQGLGLQSREISLPEHRAGQDGGQTEPWLVSFHFLMAGIYRMFF
jgi:hypothetical protein